jgi:uncharacterized protein (DUF1697 family)
MMGHSLENPPMFGSIFGSGKKKPDREPATQKQKQFAEKLGVENVESLSKEAASKEIEEKLEARDRRRTGLISSIVERVERLEKQAAKKPAKQAAKKPVKRAAKKKKK